jgi:hypothetical protein
MIAAVNEKLGICDDLTVQKNKNLIFIYSPPKVGSTTLVTSIRLYAPNMFTVLHIHDEKSLKIMCGLENITVNDIIQYNRSLGKNVWVIDIYRSPIEQKISDFFEGICIHHFNTTQENIVTYDIQKIVNRFNNLFPHLSTGDHYRDKYNIQSELIPESYDFENQKYLSITSTNGTKYIKLRLKDSGQWGQILSSILGKNIKIVSDYETANKPVINELFKKFKETYKIPKNLFDLIKNCPKLNYYYSEQERTAYLDTWSNNMAPDIHEPYTDSEYTLYTAITRENQHINEIQRAHYIYDGCNCKACLIKRNRMIQSGGKIEKFNHTEANVEHLANKIRTVNKLNAFLQQQEQSRRIQKKGGIIKLTL